MGRLKIVEMLASAVSALASAAKSVIKVIDYIIRLRHRPATGTA